MNAPLRILFLCTGNSCRSQMAEGWARALLPGVVLPASAGIERHGMNPRTVLAMAESGVDISDQWSKTLADLEDVEFDYVVTLCGHAHETCPNFPGTATVVHHGFDDPATLAQGLDEDAAMEHYRRVCLEIRDFVRGIPGNLPPRRHPAAMGFSL